MTSNVYRTAQGKTLDMGALILKNEKTRAVGNMGVNAKGDVIDDMNRIIEKKTAQVQRHYNKTVSNVSATPVTPTKNTIPTPPVEQLPPEELEALAALDAEFSDADLVPAPAPVADDPVVQSGLAAALQKAKKKKDE